MIREAVVDNLKVKIYESRVGMGAGMGKEVVEKIKFLLSRKDSVNIIFAAAPSQNEFLDFLSRNEEVDWGGVNAFHMDEYVGLAEHAPKRFSNFLKEKLFDKVSLGSVHYLNANAGNLSRECEKYADLLKQYPTDIVCMGIGENTHIAFNDPHVADFKDLEIVKVVNLDDACRQQQLNDGCFDHLEMVPSHALTLTVPALLSAEYIYCIVPGKNKSEAVYFTLKEKISEKCPASILRRHRDSVLFLDADSSAKVYGTSSSPLDIINFNQCQHE
ncbi:MAG: glucosamine-6-phosphate deaminase [Ginsengibacter sp.]